ncbi:MAG: hypothetical protein ACT4QC_10245 [Planctomycetaceae bacterium]
MRNVRTAAVVVSLLSAASLCAVPRRESTGDEPKPVVTVSADDLGSGKVVVIGRLGQPLHMMMSIRGTWESPSRKSGLPTKDGRLEFLVAEVNGKALDQPVAFHEEVVEVVYRKSDGKAYREKPTPKDRVTWELRAFESGDFRIIPGAYWDDLWGETAGEVVRAPAAPVYHRDRFVRRLVGVLVKSEPP